jgi:hypothetical protein
VSGSVSENCDDYSIVSGEGPYELNGGDTLHVVVRFKPTVEGEHECTIETGSGGCADVHCEGTGSGGTGVHVETPSRLTLYQNYPNPFNPTTRIDFYLDREERVTLAIYDLAGRVVRVLTDRTMCPGSHTESWNGRDQNGKMVASGAYFYRLRAGGRTLTRKAILLK